VVQIDPNSAEAVASSSSCAEELQVLTFPCFVCPTLFTTLSSRPPPFRLGAGRVTAIVATAKVLPLGTSQLE
jgi:hypothetical protein